MAPGPLRENTNVASVGFVASCQRFRARRRAHSHTHADPKLSHLRRGGGARPSRKSFGTALPAGAAASAGPSVKGLALTQLYQTVLKMSTENVRASRTPSLRFLCCARSVPNLLLPVLRLPRVPHRKSTRRTRGNCRLSITWSASSAATRRAGRSSRRWRSQSLAAQRPRRHPCKRATVAFSRLLTRHCSILRARRARSTRQSASGRAALTMCGTRGERTRIERKLRARHTQTDPASLHTLHAHSRTAVSACWRTSREEVPRKVPTTRVQATRMTSLARAATSAGRCTRPPRRSMRLTAVWVSGRRALVLRWKKTARRSCNLTSTRASLWTPSFPKCLASAAAGLKEVRRDSCSHGYPSSVAACFHSAPVRALMTSTRRPQQVSALSAPLLL